MDACNMIIFDIEADGLVNTVSRIHCCTFYNTEKDVFKSFTPDEIGNLSSFLRQCKDNLCGHNAYNYDLVVLAKLLNYTHPYPVYDTLIVSRILWPDKEGKAPHSVESYSNEFGVEKPKHEDWSTFTPEMLHRNKEDVKIQTLIYKKQQDFINNLAIRDFRITQESMNRVFRMEFRVAQIIEQQAINGWQLDLQKCYELVAWLTPQIEEVEGKLVPNLPITVVQMTEGGKETKAFKANGELTENAKKWCISTPREWIAGDFCKVRFDTFNIGSDKQVKDYLLSKGWKPKEYNVKKDRHNKPIRDESGRHIQTSPVLPKTPEEWQEIADLINDENIKLLAHYNKMTHRRSQIQGFIKNCRAEDHRIPAVAVSVSTNTQRMAQKIVVNVPKAKPNVYLGVEMRSLFIAAPGRVLVGCDADALEARCIAHYIYPYDRQAAEGLISGDIHDINAKRYNVSRDLAKTILYALIYGCSVPKLAKIMGIKYNQAKILFDNFWMDNPGIAQFREEVEEEYQKFGYILAIDGRPLTVRYKHALVNTKVQSCGIIAMKLALCLMHKEMGERQIRTYKQVGTFHDEIVIETTPELAVEVGEICEWSMTEAGKRLGINVPITGSAKIGANWSEVH